MASWNAIKSGESTIVHAPFHVPARKSPGRIRLYSCPVLLVGAALIATLLVRGLFPYPFLFLFFAAVMVSAWIGGTGPGLFAVFLSTVAVAYFFLPPFYSWVISAADGTYFAAFILCALVAGWVSASKKKSEQALREARDQLELRVAERTAELERSNADLRRTMQEHEEAEHALRQTQAELAHLARALTMGELTSSIAHEISQPLTAVVAHGHACLEWLSAVPPNIEKARQTTESIIQDGTRAGAVLGRIRALFKKQLPAEHWVDMNELIGEITVFVRDEAVDRGALIRTDLAPCLPRVKGDRVQLQQVVLNLLMNSIDAVSRAPSGPKDVMVRSCQRESEVLISVEDAGIGLEPGVADRIFEPFFTTKPEGIGMGLSISRSIVESHGGRLWAEPRVTGGAVFQFSLPLSPRNSNA